MSNWIVGPKQDAVNAAAAVNPVDLGPGTFYGDVASVRVEPLPLLDGNYALPVQVRTDPAYALAHPYLSSWSTVASISNAVVVDASSTNVGWPLYLSNGTRLLYLNGRRGSLTMPAPNVYRLEANLGWRRNGTEWTNTLAPRRRTSIIGSGTLAAPAGNVNNQREFEAGETYWVSFCWIPGDHSTTHYTKSYTGLNLPNAQGNAFFGTGDPDPATGLSSGVHMYTTGPNPDGQVRIETNSPVNGNVLRHSFPTPAKGVKTYFVMKITPGPSGGLEMWVNGSKVINQPSLAIGNYNTYSPKICGLGVGVYTWDGPDPDVMYVANLEYETTSLEPRVANPLSVPDLDW